MASPMAHFYPHCAHLVSLTLSQSSSIKALISSHCPPPEYTISDQKRYLATVINTLAWREALEAIIKASGVWDEGRGGLGKEAKRVLGQTWRRYLEEDKKEREAGKRRKISAPAKDGQSLKDRNDQYLRYLLLVLVHDVLVSPAKRLSTSPSWPPSKLLASMRPRLQAELVKLQIQRGKQKVQELRIDWRSEGEYDEAGQSEGRWKRGRWVRVNTRKTNPATVIAWLEKRGYIASSGESIPRTSTRPSGSSAQDRRFLVPGSLHPPDLILLPISATSELASSDLYKRGDVILQDAASCWPAWLLLGATTRSSARKALHVLDATAAPGNKTSHLSAILAGLSKSAAQCTLTALERDGRRYKTLVSQLTRAGCLASSSSSSSSRTSGLVQAFQADFLSLDPVEDPRVNKATHMLLDPSCSGSGITGRLDWLTADKASAATTSATAVQEEQEDDDDDDDDDATGAGDAGAASSGGTRLERLAEMQFKMIEHAFKFPLLRRFVYSTCSVHRIEDEDVVFRALASPLASDAKGRWKWTLAPRSECLPEWPWRGEPSFNSSQEEPALLECMLRAYPYSKIDDEGEGGVHVKRTNGFFAACFVKVYNNNDGEALSRGEELQGNETARQSEKRKRDEGEGGCDDEAEAATGKAEQESSTLALSAEERRKRKKREARKRAKSRARERVAGATEGEGSIDAESQVHEGGEASEDEWLGCRD